MEGSQPLQPKVHEPVIDDVSLGLPIYQFFLFQSCEGSLHTAGTTQFVILDEFSCGRLRYDAVFGNGFQEGKLVLGEELHHTFELRLPAFED